MPGRIIDIPTAYNALDDDQYTTLAGVPTSSFLGRQCILNDRVIAANARRAAAVCFPQADLPELFDYIGTDLGMWDVQATPGCETAQIYLRMTIPAGVTFVAVPYVAGSFAGFQGRSNALAADLPGNGAAKNYGPISVRLPPGPQRVGVVVYAPTITTATPTTSSTFTRWAAGSVVAQTAAPAGLFATLGTPPKAVVRIVDSAGTALTDWHQVIGVGQDAIAGDTAYVWPPFQRWLGAGAGRKVELVLCESADLHAMYCTEAVQTSLSSYDPAEGISTGGRGYIPLGDNAAYTGHPFMSMPWMILASNNAHEIQTRQRHEILDRYRDVALTGALTEVARYVVDSATESDAIKMRALFAIKAATFSQADFSLNWRVTTEDTAGATSVTSDTFTHTFRSGRSSLDGQMYRDERPYPLSETIRFCWPSDPYTMIQESASPWRTLVHDSSLPKRPRVVIVEASFSQDSGNAVTVGAIEVAYRGLSAVGIGG